MVLENSTFTTADKGQQVLKLDSILLPWWHRMPIYWLGLVSSVFFSLFSVLVDCVFNKIFELKGGFQPSCMMDIQKHDHGIFILKDLLVLNQSLCTCYCHEFIFLLMFIDFVWMCLCGCDIYILYIYSCVGWIVYGGIHMFMWRQRSILGVILNHSPH